MQESQNYMVAGVLARGTVHDMRTVASHRLFDQVEGCLQHGEQILDTVEVVSGEATSGRRSYS